MCNRCIKNIKVGDSLLLSIKDEYINEYIPKLSNNIVTVVGEYCNCHLLATNIDGIFLGGRHHYIEAIYTPIADEFKYFQLSDLNLYNISAIWKKSNGISNDFGRR